MNIPLKCRCGKMRGLAAQVSTTQSNRSVCYCSDCQAYAHYLGRPADILDNNGGTDVTPLRPAQLAFNEGLENLACVRLSEKGLYRWYASCCQTPISNSMSYKMPFTGVVHSIFDLDSLGMSRDEALGPIRAYVMAKSAKGTPPHGAHPSAPLSFIASVIKYLVLGMIKGLHRPSPFFNDSGAPVVTPRVLTRSERQALSL